MGLRGGARAYRVCCKNKLYTAGRMQACMNSHEVDQGPGNRNAQLLFNRTAHVLKRISAGHAWP